MSHESVSYVRRVLDLWARVALPTALIVALSFTPLAAQTPGATLTGVVSDESGAVVAGVDLTLADAANDVQRHAVSNDQGVYVFAGLPPGKYVLLAGGKGFAMVRMEGITLADGGQRSLPVTLKIGPLAESVSVEGATGYKVATTSTATKLELSPRETPQTVAVVTRQLMSDFNLTDVKQALTVAPGVFVESERNVQSYQYFARGYELQSQYDGMPALSRFGDRDVVSPDSATLERVEVLQGPSGLLSGPGFPGGTINLVRKMPTAMRQVAVEASGGSWNTFRGVGDFSGPLNQTGSARGRFVGVYEGNDSFIDYVGGKKSVLYGVIEVTPTARTVFAAGANLAAIYDSSNGAAYGHPMAHDGSDLRLPRSLNLGASWARADRSGQSYFLKVDQKAGAWNIRSQFGQAWTAADVLDSSPWGSVDPETGRGADLWAAREAWNERSTGIDVFGGRSVSFLGRVHQIMVGLNGDTRRTVGASYQESAEPLAAINVFDHDPAHQPSPYSVPFVDYGGASDSRFNQYGVFAGAHLRPTDRLHAILGSRVSWYNATTDDGRELRESAVLTPYAGVVFDVNTWASLYGSYTDIFNPHDISVKNRDGDTLPPVVGRGFEGGLKTEFFAKQLNASFAFFMLEQTNLAETDGSVPFDPENLCLGQCYVATGLVRNRGIDLGLAGALADDWQLFGGYTFSRHRHTRGELAGTPFRTQTPSHVFKMAAVYQRPAARWAVGANVRAQGETYSEDLAVPFRIQQDSYVLLGAMARYQLRPALQLQLTVENLLDTSYYSGVVFPNHGNIYGEPRRLSLTARTTF